MVSLFRKLLICLTPLFLAACMTIPSAFDYGETKAFDGVWNGRLMLSIGDQSCTSRIPVTVEVSGGSMLGKINHKGFNARVVGYINDDGVVSNGVVKVSKAFYNYEIKGKFEDEFANGTWKSKTCAGKWELRRIRRSAS